MFLHLRAQRRNLLSENTKRPHWQANQEQISWNKALVPHSCGSSQLSRMGLPLALWLWSPTNLGCKDGHKVKTHNALPPTINSQNPVSISQNKLNSYCVLYVLENDPQGLQCQPQMSGFTKQTTR